MVNVQGLSKKYAGNKFAVQDLSFGALRFFSRLDFLLQALIARPITHEGVRCLLLVSLYQLIYSKTRPYAVVDRAVDLLTAQYKPTAGTPEAAKAKELAAIEAVLSRAQQIPDRAVPVDLLEWDAQGLPV